MSYDLTLFRPKPGMDLNEAGAEFASAEHVRTPPDVARQKDKQRIARSLCEMHPEFKPWKPIESADLEAAVIRHESVWRDIELNEMSLGIQVMLFDDQVSISMPGTHTGEAAKRAWRVIWECMEYLQNHAGYRAWDPQMGRVLDVSKDYEAALKSYAVLVGFTDEVVERERRQDGGRPWWRFW